MSRLLQFFHSKNFLRQYYKPMTVIYIFTPVLIAARLGLSRLLDPNSALAINLFDMYVYGLMFLAFYVGLVLSDIFRANRLRLIVLSFGSCLYCTLGIDVWPILTSMMWNFICAFILFVEAGKVNDKRK